ncbi:MAG: hypothetical protein Q9221_008451 [Calogaya cf. arnoldii]
MKRSSEKTFGPSPESLAYKKPPAKRIKLESPEPPANATIDDDSEDSDAHPIPPGKYRASTKRPSDGTSSTNSKSRTTNCLPQLDDDRDLPATGGILPAKISTRQTFGSFASDNNSRPSIESLERQTVTPKPTASATARLPTSKQSMSSGNILERLGSFPGLSTPPPTIEDDDKDESDHNVTQEEDSAGPALVATKRQKSNSATAKAKTSRRKYAEKEVKGKIIAAVDFGTTYSGICWAHTELPENSKLITKWPDTKSEEGHSGEKIATYTLRELQYSGPNKWTSEGVPRRTSCATNSPTDPRDTHYGLFSSLRKHFEYMLSKVLGAGSLSTTTIEYVLTVPAIWSELAKSKTKACAEAAGMGSADELQMIPEPEAAAVWAFHEMASFGLEKGDAFVVCDAGGGTVDLITYEIKALNPSLRIVEVAKGEGGMCGSTMLDRRFATFLRGKFGNHPGWSENMLEEAKTAFKDRIKTGFTGNKTDEWEVPVPGLPNSFDNDPDPIRHSRYYLKGSDLYDIFEPVIQEITAMVLQQIEISKKVGADIKAVVMVGGFGENLYLYQRLQKAVTPQHIQVRMSPQAWTAVVRGALIRGLEEAKSKKALGTVVGRIARYSYGTECAREYKASERCESDRKWSNANNRWEVNTYEWFIKKHSKVTEKNPINSHYHVERLVPRPRNKALEQAKITIVKCEDDQAPMIVGKGGQVKEVTHLTVPLQKLPKKDFKVRQGEDGQDWWIIDFTLRATCHSAETYYDVTHNGKTYERVTTEYV